MANSLLPIIGIDTENPGKFFWNLKTSGPRDLLILRRGFATLDEAKEDFEKFRNDLATAEVVIMA